MTRERELRRLLGHLKPVTRNSREIFRLREQVWSQEADSEGFRAKGIQDEHDDHAIQWIVTQWGNRRCRPPLCSPNTG